MIPPERVNRLLRLVMDQLDSLPPGSDDFDESAPDYEAARLDCHPVLILLCVNGFDDAKRDFESADVFVLKGTAECYRFLRGETETLESKVLSTLSLNAAHALRRAFIRRGGKPRLIARDGKMVAL